VETIRNYSSELDFFKQKQFALLSSLPLRNQQASTPKISWVAKQMQFATQSYSYIAKTVKHKRNFNVNGAWT
jgi:hypothetical protein